MIQFALAFFGLTAMFMATGHSPRARRWAPIVGLCGQPFWIAFAISTEAWGLLLLSIAYSLVYVNGIRVQWRKS
jgi:hypothetical protein